MPAVVPVADESVTAPVASLTAVDEHYVHNVAAAGGVADHQVPDAAEIDVADKKKSKKGKGKK
jgi:hypothetical protein